MFDLTEEDYELIKAARAAIRRNYDGEKYNHTVGAAVRCGDGRIYRGVNVYSMHGACAEQGEEILPPCGNCCQILCDYAPDCQVILSVDGAPKKIPAKELLPFAYCFEG